MNYSLALEIAALLLGTVGVAKAVTMLVARVAAERDWTRAVQELTPDQIDLFADFVAEREMLAAKKLTRVEQVYLANAVRDLVVELHRNRRIPDRSAKVLESALQQPSEAGRKAYADKLVREAGKTKVGVG